MKGLVQRNRTFTAVTLVALLAIVRLVTIAAPTSANATIVERVVNANGGVYWRSQPDWNTPIAVARHGVYSGDFIALDCYVRGGTVPPYYNNPLWYQAHTVSGFGLGQGLVNDHFIDTGNNLPNIVVPGVPACDSVTTVSAPQSPVQVNGKNVGYPQNNPHAWGNCKVQDFNGGPYGWVIVSWGYWTSAQHTGQNYVPHTALVRNGMLFGWFDQGGAAGSMGCPMNDEHGYMNGVRQDFQIGSLYWVPTMNHAARIDFGREGAIAWAWGFNGGGTNYADQCLQFVVDAYQYGQNWHLTGGPYDSPGFVARAYQWWYSRSASDQHPHDTNAPRGALVIWDRWASQDGSGHITLSLGGGLAISTEFGGLNTVHVIRISSYPSYYLGWVSPL